MNLQYLPEDLLVVIDVVTTVVDQILAPLHIAYHCPQTTDYSPHAWFVLVPRAPFGAPVWNPFLNFRGTSFIDRIRPVPVVFLLFAFIPQLSIEP